MTIEPTSLQGKTYMDVLQPRQGRVLLASVTSRELSIPHHEAAVSLPAAGAVVSFSGVVRDHDRDRGVHALEYHGHPAAQTVLARVVGEVSERFPNCCVAVSHRIGMLSIGDAALVVAVSSAHRREAFDACSELVEQVKEHLPVWKRQVFADGTDEWVNCA